MGKNSWFIGLLIGCSLLIACGRHIPKDVILPDKMEEILYDYHLSISMSDNIPYEDNYKKKSYQNFVFQKHGITEAEFDSSMVWYTRNTELLADIYTNLSQRFSKQRDYIENFLEARKENDFVSMPGDTVDVWPYKSLYWLTDNRFNNQFVFKINPDSNFHVKDAFLWKANYTFIAKGNVTMALNILYDNDSVVGLSKQITQSGTDSIYLCPDSANTIRSLNGFIHLTSDSTSHGSVIINDISLIKYHTITDSISNIKDQEVTE